jgi:hypothetical protein
MRRASGVQAPAPPQLTYRGGPLLDACEVFIIFWGNAWNAGTPRTLQKQLSDFFTFILTSALVDQLAEYDVPGHAIGHGQFLGSTVVATPQPTASTGDNSIRNFLQQQIVSNASLPRPTPNLLYFIYLPPGSTVVQGGSKSCQAFCGYHDAISDPTFTEIFYAVMPYPGCAGCRGGLTVLDALTATSSHELCEAITDAVPGQGWYDDANGEIGDICAWKMKKVGAYTVQQEWSNRANKCV